MRAYAAGLLLIVFALSGCAGGTASPDVPTASPGLTTAAVSPTPSPPPEITLIAAGDVMLGRSIGEGIVASGTLYPFEFAAPPLREADIAFANLESPITDRGEPAAKDFVFRGPTQGARALRQAGLDVLSLANNHMLDYGLEGLADTRAALQGAGLAYTGAGDNESQARAPVVVRRGGLRVAFLAYVSTPPDSGSGFDVAGTQATADRPGVAWLSAEAVSQDVTAAKQQADVVVVSMHTGAEYQETPTDLQVAAAHAAVDAGASLVLGSHPHVLQGIERYKGGLIAYSLGNFLFDFDSVDYSHPDLPSALSALLRVRLTAAGVAGCEVLPVIVGEADGRPRPATGADAERVLARLRRLSDGSCGVG